MVESGTEYFVRTDHIGRPVFATDASGTVAWQATFLPFGGVQASTSPLIDLGFPGQWCQGESGLHQNWMRDYDPTTGRYLQVDPLGLFDSPAVYNYARQNPMVYADRAGENALSQLIKKGAERAAKWCKNNLRLQGPDDKLRLHGRGRVLQFLVKRGGKRGLSSELTITSIFVGKAKNFIAIVASTRLMYL